MSLLAELKRRKVIRVAVVYAATAFAVLQAADIMLPQMGVPEWGLSLVVALIVLGFPIAIVLGWALEVTPEGVRVTPSAALDDSADGAATPALLGKRTLAVAGGLLLLGIGLGAGWFLKPPAPPAPPAEPAAAAERAAPVAQMQVAAEIAPVPEIEATALARGVAVLPFENLSEDPANAFFAGGVHEEVLTSLSLIADLRVISRTSMLRIAESQLDVPAMAQRLGVSHVLEGSVRRAGNRVRVTVQLIDAARDEHLWAENYDRELDDIFAIQSDIARAIAEQLRIELSPRESEALAERPTNNPKAHDLYLRAVDQSRIASGVSGFRTQIALLDQALALDPDFLQARLLLAEAHGRIFWLGGDTAGSHLARTRELVEEISRRWPDRPEARLARAMYLYLVESDYPGALEACQDVLPLRPNDAWVLGCIAGSHKRLNQREENLVAARRWLEIDPESNSAWFEVFNALAQLGRGEEAIEVADRARALFPEQQLFEYWRAFYLLAFRGEMQPVLALADATPGLSSIYARSFVAEALFASGDIERALAVLSPAAGGYDLDAVAADLLRAELLFYAGRRDEARSTALRAYDYLEDRGQTEFAALPPRTRGAAYARAAAVAAAAGQREAAADWSRRAQSEPRLDNTDDRDRLVELARAASLLGDHDAAWAHYTDGANTHVMMMAPGMLRALRPVYDARFGQSADYQAHMARIDSGDAP
jgi:TolB-like protein